MWPKIKLSFCHTMPCTKHHVPFQTSWTFTTSNIIIIFFCIMLTCWVFAQNSVARLFQHQKIPLKYPLFHPSSLSVYWHPLETSPKSNWPHPSSAISLHVWRRRWVWLKRAEGVVCCVVSYFPVWRKQVYLWSRHRSRVYLYSGSMLCVAPCVSVCVCVGASMVTDWLASVVFGQLG